ncbi:thiamine-phosphate kinase [Methylotuvimicrobium sp. KM2]|jgi:thiamine-monophosphate kinase|uniref:thiamine-phosphate kinase n=1 Tax=Methylotuvimicrobium sp. KM2 TaxID=3133976 RepID=UPI003101A50E
MPTAEFDLIERFFAVKKSSNAVTELGIGDDCALLSVPAGYRLAITADTMVENVHFLAGTDPYDLGYKLLAVNLSDLASMGAEPIAVTLALTLPDVDESWLERFAEGFFGLAAYYRIDLIGGDTTSGPLTLTVQAMGIVPEGQALLRSGARAGDGIYMTGKLGDAGLGLKIAQGHFSCSRQQAALERFNRPKPRVEEGLVLRNIARSCIDVSDGLAQDLGHILKQSGVGACLDWEGLPLSNAVKAYIEATGDWTMPLRAGDDYELCFTVPADKAELLTENFTRIGVIEDSPGLRIHRFGTTELLRVQGFEHFSH